MSRSERMAPVDTTWLRMDRPANPMVITGVLILEGPVDLNRLEQRIAERLLVIPRFRQRIVSNGLEHTWTEHDDLDIARHIRRARLPGKGGREELERFVGELASEQLDKSRPLWQFHIIEHYEGGAAVVSRIHHAIADGIALIGVLLSLMDASPENGQRSYAGASGERGSGNWLFDTVPNMVRQGAKVTGEAWREALSLATSPAKTVRAGVGVAAELAYLLLMPTDSATRFKGVPRGTKRVAWTDPIQLPEVKIVSRALGCSVNDMLLAAVAGALHDYLREKGERTAGVEVRALVPVNLRGKESEGELGNRFGIVAVELPVGMENPLARLGEVHRRMETLKSSLEPPVTLGLLTALGYAPQLVQDKLFDLLLSRATAVMTNVPGPQHPLYLAGARIGQIMFWVPSSGDIGMGVSILSFNGHVQFGLMTDTAMVPDPQAIIDRFRPEFEQLLYHVLMHEWDGEPEPRRSRVVSETEPAGDDGGEPEPIKVRAKARKPAAKRQANGAKKQPARSRARPAAKGSSRTGAAKRGNGRGRPA